MSGFLLNAVGFLLLNGLKTFSVSLFWFSIVQLPPNTPGFLRVVSK